MRRKGPVRTRKMKRSEDTNSMAPLLDFMLLSKASGSSAQQVAGSHSAATPLEGRAVLLTFLYQEILYI